MTRRFYHWLKRKVGIPEGSVIPWWFMPVAVAFHPLLYVRWGLWENLGPIKVDFMSNTVTIYGVEMTWEYIAEMRRRMA